MKKLGFILMACALILGTSQCKKNNEANKPENNGKSVFITLNVGGDTRANVVPEDDIAPVYYEEGDMIYVVSDGKYIGTLTYNGSNFTGDITNPTEGQPLHFYFLGNVTPNESLVLGETSTCSVVISDQTTSLPVISYASSTQNYSVGTTNYTATLLNKCALVKFNVTTSSQAVTCITGMNNKVMVDFSSNTLIHSKEGTGIIKLAAGSGEKWAILLPQEALAVGAAGSAYSADGDYTGICGAVPAITDNGYLTSGIDVTVTTEVNPDEVPTGAICGKFTINENGDQVYFSQGNLQYQASTNAWRFATNQYDCIGTFNSRISQTYTGWIDLFGWGTSGYNHGAVCYQPWNTSRTTSDYYAYGQFTYNLYDQTGQADWGYNAISNGGNTTYIWRTLTGGSNGEWKYVFDTRSTSSGIRYAKAKVNGMNGVILLPDNWSASTYSLSNTNQSNADYSSNVISAMQWSTLQDFGAVFLPAAGERSGTTVNLVGIYGNYWSSSCYDSSSAYYVNFSDGFLAPASHNGRHIGFSVRLVRACQ